MKIKVLVGSGSKIGLLTLPFLVVGVVLNIFLPELFSVGGPPIVLAVISIIFLIFGVIIWAWSVYLIITKIPKKQLITSGPYAYVKHPLYMGVAILVLPWVGFLANTWLGAVLGLVVYFASRRYAPEEEAILAKSFGKKWNSYSTRVKIKWL